MYRYKTIKVGGRTELLHRHIAEKTAGSLNSAQHVHHINDNTHDNSPGNLEVMSAEDHRKHHAAARLVHPRTKTCEVCGAEYVPHRTKRKRGERDKRDFLPIGPGDKRQFPRHRRTISAQPPLTRRGAGARRASYPSPAPPRRRR